MTDSTRTVPAILAKCLGCQETKPRPDAETTATPKLVRIRCATCGAKRIATVVEPGAVDLTPEERETLRKHGEPIQPDPPTLEDAGLAVPEVDLVAEARRIFDVAEPTSEEPTIDHAYRAWLATADGKTVSLAIRDRALALRRRGWSHYGIAALFEAARFDRDLDVGPDVDGWKLNNNFRSRLARDLMARVPELEAFFETRELRS